MNKIIITGGAGFIGSNAAEYFHKKKWKVFVIDNLSRKGAKINLVRIKKKVFFKFGDIKNKNFVNNFLKKIRPNVILHCAGQVAVTTSIKNPREDFEINILGTLNLLEAIRKNNLKTKFIYTSTNKVYGNLSHINTKIKKNRYEFKKISGINENFNLDFHSPYGCSKGAADQYVRDYSRIFNINSFVLRQSCIYGHNQFGIEDQGWVAWLIIASILNKKIKIYGNGKQVRDILFIDDLNKLFEKLALTKKIKSGIYNVGGGNKNSLSIIELVEILRKNIKNKINYKYENWRKGDQKIFISDNSKIKKDLNWYPKVKKLDGIKKLIKWAESNKKLISKVIK